MKQMTGLTIGTLAEESGVGIEAVRFYERQGLKKVTQADDRV